MRLRFLSSWGGPFFIYINPLSEDRQPGTRAASSRVIPAALAGLIDMAGTLTTQGKRTPPEVVGKIISSYIVTHSAPDTAKELNIPEKTIYNVLAREITPEKLAELFNQKKTEYTLENLEAREESRDELRSRIPKMDDKDLIDYNKQVDFQIARSTGEAIGGTTQITAIQLIITDDGRIKGVPVTPETA